MGLCDLEPLNRNKALSLLQYNIHSLQNNKLFENDLQNIYAQLNIDQGKFESLWTTFFDVYDTLESYSTHLTKSIWDRTEKIYSFLKDNISTINQDKHQLINFKTWM